MEVGSQTASPPLSPLAASISCAGLLTKPAVDSTPICAISAPPGLNHAHDLGINKSGRKDGRSSPGSLPPSSFPRSCRPSIHPVALPGLRVSTSVDGPADDATSPVSALLVVPFFNPRSPARSAAALLPSYLPLPHLLPLRQTRKEPARRREGGGQENGTILRRRSFAPESYHFSRVALHHSLPRPFVLPISSLLPNHNPILPLSSHHFSSPSSSRNGSQRVSSSQTVHFLVGQGLGSRQSSSYGESARRVSRRSQRYVQIYISLWTREKLC